MDILYELAYHLTAADYKKSLEYGEISTQQGKKLGDSLRIVKAGRIKSYIFMRQLNKMDSSLILSSANSAYCQEK